MREGWEYKKIGDIATVVSGSTPQTSVEEFWGKGHYWVTPAEIDDKTVYVAKTERQITDAALAKVKLQRLPKGTVLLSSRAPIGKVAICDVDMYCNQGFKNCICSDLVYNKYLFYFLKDKKEYLKSLGRGAIFKEISKGIVEKVVVPLPPKPTQLSIVSELDKLNELIRIKKEQLKDYDALAQSIFYEMFGDPVENEKGWEVKELIETVSPECKISYGIVQPGEHVEDGVSIVRPVDMVSTFISKDGLKKTTKEISNSYSRTILSGKELLICVRGTTGVVSLVDESLQGANVTRGIAPLLFSENVERWFMYYQVKSSSVRSVISSLTRGIALKQINMSDLRKIRLILPPLSLQQSFAHKIEQIERQKVAVQRTIKDLETLLAARMQYWFE